MNKWIPAFLGMTGLFFSLFFYCNLTYALNSQSPDRTRGAILFMNYCSGCHSLRYLSWPRMVNDLHLTKISSYQVNQHLRLSVPNLAQTWPQIGMAPWDAKHWFGKPPPDLSLIANQRGVLWIQKYLQSFYPDPNKRFGINNHVLVNSMMPNVLETLQQELYPQDFSAAVADIAYFLNYASDPSIVIRMQLGWFVIGFLALFCLLFWLRMRSSLSSLT
ncbi:MAG: cytochrome c1 [Gammaproteobacteria bacterium]